MTQVVVRLIDLHVMRWVEGEPHYLVMQRSPGEIYEHVWQGVTGKIKPGEAAWQAAIRELKEETGLGPGRMWAVDHVNFFYENATDTLNCIPVFGAEVNRTDIRLSSEHRDFRWGPLEEAVELLLWEQQKQGLRIFHDMLTDTRSREKLRWMEVDLGGE